jgi:hypothetical protein
MRGKRRTVEVVVCPGGEEQDPNKLAELVMEVNPLLEAKRKRLSGTSDAQDLI